METFVSRICILSFSFTSSTLKSLYATESWLDLSVLIVAPLLLLLLRRVSVSTSGFSSLSLLKQHRQQWQCSRQQQQQHSDACRRSTQFWTDYSLFNLPETSTAASWEYEYIILRQEFRCLSLLFFSIGVFVAIEILHCPRNWVGLTAENHRSIRNEEEEFYKSNASPLSSRRNSDRGRGKWIFFIAFAIHSHLRQSTEQTS